MSKLDQLLIDSGIGEMPFDWMYDEAIKQNISTEVELRDFINTELRVAEVADALPYDIRAKGFEYRMQVAREIISRVETEN